MMKSKMMAGLADSAMYEKWLAVAWLRRWWCHAHGGRR
jgi:hypothetical protein